MKLLLVGSENIWSIEKYYLKYLKNHLDHVSLFPARNYINEFRGKGFINKVLYRILPDVIHKKVNQELKVAIEKNKPDALWVFKGMEIFPETLLWAKMNGIKLINYNPDHPFLFSGRGSGNNNVSQSIKHYDLHFCYNKIVMQKLITDYNLKTAFLPFGAEIEESLFYSLANRPEIIRTCFIGSPDKIRVNIIKEIANAGYEVDVYGNEWNKYSEIKNNILINVFEAVYDDEFWKKIRQYRIQLNIFRNHNIGSHNMRSFEIPSIGGIMLAPDSPEHREFFTPGKEIFLYQGLKDLINKIDFILELSKSEAIEIRNNARDRFLRQGYSYKKLSDIASKEIIKIV